MDLAAEFTLRVAALAQSNIPGAKWPERWLLLPEIKQSSWNEARDHLTKAPKPLIVAPLSEPDHLGVWARHAGDSAVAAHIKNQVSFYEEKIPRLSHQDDDELVLGTPVGEFLWSIGGFRLWLSNYGVLARVVLSQTTDPRVGQILVLASGAPRRPLNPHRPFPPPKEGGSGHGDHSHDHA